MDYKTLYEAEKAKRIELENDLSHVASVVGGVVVDLGLDKKLDRRAITKLVPMLMNPTSLASKFGHLAELRIYLEKYKHLITTNTPTTT